ncbi:hypothetical protein NPIL_533981 [Nephila pilipes]|uniref:Uncharacterized protein n=1 Tax=Nephila pilipes TaxID=299642 RepID=A0A8X6P9D3_NEPPI|nr:hypothetical protein NPIL_533981 [Nephila pilipes]
MSIVNSLVAILCFTLKNMDHEKSRNISNRAEVVRYWEDFLVKYMDMCNQDEYDEITNPNIHFSMNINPVTCHRLKGNAGWDPDEFFSKFVSQVCSNYGYVGSSIDYHSAGDFVYMPHNEKSVVAATDGKNMKHFEMGLLTL